MWGEQGYADQFDPRRRIPGSGMPPTAAPQFGNQMSRGTPFAGAPALVPARSASNNIIDPQVMKMMMEMLSRRNQQQAPAAVGISPTVVQAAPSPVQSQAMDGFWAKGSPAPQGGGWLGMLGGLFGQGGGGADVFPRGLDVGV